MRIPFSRVLPSLLLQWLHSWSCHLVEARAQASVSTQAVNWPFSKATCALQHRWLPRAAHSCSPILHTAGWQGALPTVGKTAKGQLWHFPLPLFSLMEKAEHSWVSSLVLPTSVTHKSLIGHAKSCHLGLLGLLCFLTLYLLTPRLQELRVSSFKTFLCSSQFKQVVVPCPAAVSAKLHLQI